MPCLPIYLPSYLFDSSVYSLSACLCLPVLQFMSLLFSPLSCFASWLSNYHLPSYPLENINYHFSACLSHYTFHPHHVLMSIFPSLSLSFCLIESMFIHILCPVCCILAYMYISPASSSNACQSMYLCQSHCPNN